MTALNGLGIYSDELIDRGIDFLNSQFDSFNRRYGAVGHYFFWYGHYYGVQAMYTKGGHDWVNYFTRLRELPGVDICVEKGAGVLSELPELLRRAMAARGERGNDSRRQVYV